jgi:hypothetical protein
MQLKSKPKNLSLSLSLSLSHTHTHTDKQNTTTEAITQTTSKQIGNAQKAQRKNPKARL